MGLSGRRRLTCLTNFRFPAPGERQAETAVLLAPTTLLSLTVKSPANSKTPELDLSDLTVATSILPYLAKGSAEANSH